MASAQYTLNINPEDLQPDSPPPELTPEQKRANFWYYYKWHVVGILVALAIVGSMIYDVVTQVHPDYEIGLITTIGYPAGIEEVLGEKLAPFFDDRNGDGEVVVSVGVYSLAKPTDETFDPNMHMANQTKLIGDISTGQSMIFIVDEPALLNAQYGLFLLNDGSEPAIYQVESDEDLDGGRVYDPADNEFIGVRWADCPKLTALDLGEPDDTLSGVPIPYQMFLENFRLAMRIFDGSSLADDEKAVAYFRDSAAALADMTAR